MRDEAATEFGHDLLPGYEEWLERLTATYRSVAYYCLHRLQDRALAEGVSVEVVAEMLARPKVFRYCGLPFSGQIGRSAEPRIARLLREKQQGEAGEDAKEWQRLFSCLRSVSQEHQEVFVLAYVEGCSDAEISAALERSEDAARQLREDMAHLLQELSKMVLLRNA
jgi:DNA-directed RNA polymerase specialized sigma24 family protein